MKRSEFLKYTTTIAGGAAIIPLPYCTFGNEEDINFRRYLCKSIESPEVILPENRRIPLGWQAFPVKAAGKPEEMTRLYFPKLKDPFNDVWLRITAATNFREEVVLGVYLSGSGKLIGEFSIRYAHPFQPFQFRIDHSNLKEIEEQGLSLRMLRGETDTWFFSPKANRGDNIGLLPQIFSGSGIGTEKSFLNNLYSMNSFAPFGWIGGSVQDALYAMAEDKPIAMKTLRKHLESYLDDELGVKFENPHSEPKDGEFDSIEDFLPMAAISGIYPDHPSIQLALDFFQRYKNIDGIILYRINSITTEGCYTVSYPIATIAEKRNDVSLAETAVDQILFRKKYLAGPDTVYQRRNLETMVAGFPNWGRAATWYLLGIVKTLEVLKRGRFSVLPGITEIEKEFQRAVKVVVSMQNNKGLWYSFMDREETGVDTSASAGIAASLALGYKLGILGSEYLSRAQQTYNSLLNYLTPDGFLDHISQINRGGEALQSSPYRVLSQFGMGLMAQLKWQLERG